MRKGITVVFPLQFIWSSSNAVAKQVHICFFGLPTKTLDILETSVCLLYTKETACNIPFLHWIKEYFVGPYTWISKFLEVLKLNRLFHKLN